MVKYYIQLRQKSIFLLLAFVLILVESVFGQTTISTTPLFTNNNGSGTVTFNFQNTNGFPIVITDIEGLKATAGAAVVEFWYKTTPINGAPGVISVANGWTQVAAGTASGVASTTVPQTFFTGLSFTVPAGATYGFAVFATSQPYHSIVAPNLPLTTFSGGGCNILAGTNISYGGGAPNGTAPTFTPRGWIGKITFVPAGPCTNPPVPGTVTALSTTVCPNTNFTLSLVGSTGGIGQTYQWETSTNNSTWTPIAGAINASYMGTQITSNYYRCQVTCGVTVASASLLMTTNGTPLAGTYTLDPALPAGGTNYQTFVALATDLSCAGVSAPVIVNVANGTYTEQVEIGNIPGSSAVNTVTINGNGATLTFAAATTAAHTLMLSGADYMTYNNLNVVGTGATYALACHLWNQSDNNSFNNCTFTVPANCTGTAQVPFSLSGSATAATTAGISGNNNILTGCTMNSGYYNTCLVGNTGTAATGNKLINCNLLDFYFYGSYNGYQANLLISGNTVERPTRTTLSTFYGIYLVGTASNNLIEKNKIRNPFGANPTFSGTVYALYCTIDGTAGNENKFYNNLVSDINSSGTGAIYAMYFLGADYIQAYHNTISLDNTTSASTGVSYGLYSTGTLGGMAFANNNITISRGGTGTKYCLYFTGGLQQCNSNNLYMNAAAGTNNVAFYLTAYSTLGLWQGANGGVWDQQSVSIDPIPQAPGAPLYNYTPTIPALDGAGLALSVSSDILGNPRNMTTPDIGCYEFTIVSTDAGVQSLVTPAVGNGCYSTAETISVEIRNFGISAINFATNPATISCNILGPVNSSLTGTPTGILASGATMVVTLTGTADMSVNGTYTIYASINMTGDQNSANNALTPSPTRTKIPITTGTISALPNTLCVSGNVNLSITGNSGANVQWQSSTVSNTGPWTNVGTNANSYAATGVNQTTYYQAVLSCNTSSVATNLDTVIVNSPAIVTTTPASICGAGSMTLGATSTAGSTVNWFTAATGGSAIDTGNTYTTPFLTSTTTYWAAGVTGAGGTATVAMPGAGTAFTGNVRGFWFTAPTSFTITGLQDMGIGAGTQSITVVKFTGNTPPPTFATVTNAFTVLYLTQNNPATGVIPVNIPINAGEVIGIMGQRSNVCSYAATTGAYATTIAGLPTTLTRMGMQFPLNTSVPQSLWQEPTAQIGRVEITYQVGCESPRVAVSATITPGPTFAITPNQLVCNNVITPLAVTSNVNDFNQYTWSPTTNLYTDAAATIPYTGTALTIGSVYHKSTASGTQVFYCNAYNTSTLCAGVDTISVTVQPSAVVVNGDSVCISGPAILKLLGTNVGLQWQEQIASVWTDIAGATSSIYTTPSLSVTTNYQVKIMNGLGANCFIEPVPVVVSNPQVLTTAAGTRCGVGPVVLGATANAGSTLYWYNNAALTGLPLGTGTTFTTPSISATTNYYVMATAGTTVSTPGNLFTTNVAGNSAYGNLFDVQAVNTIRIDSFSIYATTANTAFSVYYRVGTGVGFNTAATGWTLIGTGTIGTINPIPANLTRIPLNINLILNAGQTYSFAISTGTAVNYSNGTAVGNILAQDPNLKVYEGYGGSTANPGFGFINTTRNFNGRIYYTKDLSCSSAATSVTATVTAPPALSLSTTTTSICVGTPSTAVNITSPTTNYNTYAWLPATGVSGSAAAGYTFNPSATTTYLLTGTQTSGSLCQDTAAITITVKPVPITPTVTPNAVTVCSGAVQTLTASGSNNNVTAATGTGVLTTAVTAVTPYSSFYEGAHEQYLVLASELTAMGFIAGSLNSVAFNVTALGAGTFAQSGFSIKMAHTANTALTSAYGTPIGAFTTVYGPVSQGLPTLGLNTYTFTTPFNWDGTSNILVDICHDNDPTNTCTACYSSNSTVTYTATTFNSVWGTYNDNAAACGISATLAIAAGFTNRPNMTFSQSIIGNYTWGPTATLYTNTTGTTPYTGTILNPVYAVSTANTTYTVTATGLNGCTSSSNATVTINQPAIADAGNGQTICYGTAANLSATSSGGANAGTWSGGAGTFALASSATTTYTPALSESGTTVTLTWTTNTTGVCPAASDTVNITVNAPATANAGANASVCVTGVKVLTAVSTPATGSWSTPNGSGAFGNATSANTIYTPNAADVAASPILLVWTTIDPAGPCGSVSDTLSLGVNDLPIANAGNGQSICYGTVANLAASASGGAIGGTWSGGAGVFSSLSNANAIYTPDVSENGTTVTLTWTTVGSGSCTAVSDTVNITINTPATATAGTDATICVSGTQSLSAVSMPSTGAWSTPNGAGPFANNTLANTIYTPAAADVAASPILLIWTTSVPSVSCPAKSDTLLLTVDAAAIADAGNGQTICYGSVVNLGASISGGATSGAWTGGAGSYSSTTAANASYTPALSESGTTFTLTWTSNATGTCAAASDTVNITINTPASANVGADATICVSGTQSLTAVSTPSTGGWSTPNGAGSFANNTSANTIYMPVAADVAASPILLIWTTSAPLAPCTAKSDTLLLTVDAAAVANAGNGQTICYGSVVNLGASISGGATSGTWTGGAGSYSSTTAANASYTPVLSESGTTFTLTWTSNATGSCAAASDTVNISINSPATANAGTDISVCGANPVTLGASVGGTATSGTWSGTYAGSFSSLTNATGTYTPAASEVGSTVTLIWTSNDPDGAGPCSAATDNVTVTVNGYATTIAPPTTSATSWIADYEGTDAFGWTHYYDDAGTAANYCDDYLMVSVLNANSAGNNIGHIGNPGFEVKIGGQGAYSLTNATTPYVMPGVNWYLMGRYWNLTPVTQPVNDVNVKFYFTNTDFNAVNAVSPYVSTSPTQMAFYKINNGVGGTPSFNPDPALLHAGVSMASPFTYDGTGYWQYINGATASTTTWAYSSMGTDHVAEYTIDRFSGGGGGGGSNNPGAFPVELLSFSGYNNGDENILQWTTAKEINNKNFILMHSVDNIAFEEIANVPTQAPNGISNTALNYTVKDLDFAAKTYYRLRQIDIDGTSRMYPATVEVNVNNELNTVVALYPNPAKDVLNVSITQPQGGKHKIEVYDAIGKLVSVHKADLIGGNNVMTLDVATLAKGTYIIIVKNADNGTVANTRFVKE